MNKRTWIGALALMLALAMVLAACGGGKSVEQLTKESRELAEQMAGLDPSNAADAAKLAKLGAQALKLAAELEKAEGKAAGKPAAEKSAKSGGSGKPVTAATEAKETDFIYELNKAGDGVIITGYQKDAAGGALVIPAKIEGYPVVAIRNADAYSALFGGGAAPITSIVFPDSITEISNAWGSNTGSLVYSSASVTSIVFPKNQQASQNQGARQ